MGNDCRGGFFFAGCSPLAMVLWTTRMPTAPHRIAVSPPCAMRTAPFLLYPKFLETIWGKLYDSLRSYTNLPARHRSASASGKLTADQLLCIAERPARQLRELFFRITIQSLASCLPCNSFTLSVLTDISPSCKSLERLNCTSK